MSGSSSEQNPGRGGTHDPQRRRLLGSATAAIGLVSAVAPPAMADVPQGRPADTAPARPASRRFEGKVVQVTGGTSGIGRAAVFAFAAEGARVAFCGRRQALGEQVAAQVRAAGGEATFLRADVLVEDDVRAFVERTVQQYGRLDVAFDNAGITLEKPLHEYSVAEWDSVVNTNLRGTFISMKYQLPRMLEAGHGVIVVTASSNAIATQAKRAAYSASKRGLVGLVQSAALDYAKHGIRVNALIPGTTNTPLVRRVAGMENMPDFAWEIAARQWGKSNVPGLGRMATPEEIAAFALVLASDDFPYITGAQMVIDGGKTAHA